MWSRLSLLLVCVSVALSAEYLSHDVPLRRSIAEEDSQEALRRVEERLVRMTADLAALTQTVSTRLQQVDANMLQLYKELGSSRLQQTLDQLRQAAAPAQQSDLAASLSQQLETQLNSSHQQLATLLQEARLAPAESGSAAATTIIVERCSYRDQFQTIDQWRPADCAAIQQRHQRSGVYTIYPSVCGNGGGIRVFCDMETDGGGWTVLTRRADTPRHQSFNLSWQSYKWGFGNLSSEFWLGNEYMNLLTSMDQMQLRVDLHDWKNDSRMALYTPFSVGTEQQKYAIKLGKYSGNAGDSLTPVNNAKFSTKDQDNDSWSKHCAVVYQNPGWHKACMHATLTGPYHEASMKTAWIGIVWNAWKGNKYSLKHVEMKMRPVNYMTWCHKLAQGGARE